MKRCEFCERDLPEGCAQIYGDYPECPLGRRTGVGWKVGFAVYKDLMDRRGIKNELGGCDLNVQAEIIETIGKIAIKEYLRHKAKS